MTESLAFKVANKTISEENRNRMTKPVPVFAKQKYGMLVRSLRADAEKYGTMPGVDIDAVIQRCWDFRYSTDLLQYSDAEVLSMVEHAIAAVINFPV